MLTENCQCYNRKTVGARNNGTTVGGNIIEGGNRKLQVLTDKLPIWTEKLKVLTQKYCRC